VGKQQRPLEGHLRTWKIRMLPDAKQRRELERHFAAARWAYNSAVAGVERQKAVPTFLNLRDGIMGRGKVLPPVAAGVHNKFLARAIKQAADAYQSNFAKMRKQGKTHRFRVQFRSHRKTPTEVLVVERANEGPFAGFEPSAPVTAKRRDTSRAECRASFGGALKAVGGIRLQDKKKVIDELLGCGKTLPEDAKILWDKRSRTFHFVYTHVLPKLDDPKPDFEEKRCLSADLGIHPPVQWYQPDGSHGALFDGVCTRGGELQQRCERLDRLQSRVDRRRRNRAPGKGGPKRKRRRTTQRLHRKLARERRRLHHWVEAAHYNGAKQLLQRADVLIVPRLASQRLSRKRGRNIAAQSVRSMLTFSPGLFCDRLQSAAVRYAGRHVFCDTGEPGTSKTASCCGWWNKDLKVGTKVCKCPRCHVSIDRQVNGARGNLFAAIGKATGIPWDGQSG
jgi:transposase